MKSSVTKKEGIIVMTNLRELYNNLIVKLQEFTYTIGASKRIQVMSEYIDIDLMTFYWTLVEILVK